MAKCSICGKGVTFGHNVSHSNRKTNRTWKPNIRSVKAIVDGSHQTIPFVPVAFAPVRLSALNQKDFRQACGSLFVLQKYEICNNR
jgi:large subunit ribosomal protein L28